jgi:hypothetical protein
MHATVRYGGRGQTDPYPAIQDFVQTIPAGKYRSPEETST